MNSKYASSRGHFNSILIEMEHDHGTRDTCVYFLECLKEALLSTSFTSTQDIKNQFSGMYELFTHMKPRMAIIQNYLDIVLEHIVEDCSEDAHALVQHMIAHIKNSQQDNAERSDKLKHIAVSAIPNNARILIHSNSHTVLDTLELATHTHKKFSVIIAEQEASRTLDIAKFLHTHSIPFTVVPEYMLSSIEMDITCMLIGAVTLKHDMHFVVDAGTKAIVSEMNMAHVPVYILLTSNKFSYWKTKAALQTQKSVKSIAHPHADFSFERVKFSHDRLPLKQVDKIFTEEGCFTPEAFTSEYRKKLQEYKELHREIAAKKCIKNVPA